MTPAAPDLSDEERLVLLLSRRDPDPNREAGLRELLRRPLSWPDVLDLAWTHELYPLVYLNLESVDFVGVPDPAREDLKRLYSANALRAALIRRETARVLRVLAGLGIPAIPWKGPGLAEAIYGDATSRVSIDIDLIVRREDVDRACGALQGDRYQSGHATTFVPTARRRSADHHFLLIPQSPPPSPSVEVHWGVLRGSWNRPAMDALWRDARAGELFGAPCWMMSREWELLSLALHASQHSWRRLKFVVDIHHYCLAGQIDWNRVEQMAGRYRWSPILGITLGECRRLFETPLPPGIRVIEPPSLLHRRPSDPEPDPSAGLRMQLRLLPDLRAKLGYLFDTLLTPSMAEEQAVRLPRPLGPLYWLIRPIRLIVKRLAARFGR